MKAPAWDSPPFVDVRPYIDQLDPAPPTSSTVRVSFRETIRANSPAVR